MRVRPQSARVVLAALAALLLFAAPARAQDGKKVLKLGWAQDPQTLSPFVDYDEEDFRIWAINYDLLVNFSPDNLGPAPGIAESWDVSDDKKTVTFHLIKGAKWSDGEPITSKDVKFSLDVLGDNGVHARSAVGVAVLPLDSPVEVELLVEVVG